jgi:hypothetical protein
MILNKVLRDSIGLFQTARGAEYYNVVTHSISPPTPRGLRPGQPLRS